MHEFVFCISFFNRYILVLLLPPSSSKTLLRKIIKSFSSTDNQFPLRKERIVCSIWTVSTSKHPTRVEHTIRPQETSDHPLSLSSPPLTSSKRARMMVIQCLMVVTESGWHWVRMASPMPAAELTVERFSSTVPMKSRCVCSSVCSVSASSGSTPRNRSVCSASDSHSRRICTLVRNSSACRGRGEGGVSVGWGLIYRYIDILCICPVYGSYIFECIQGKNKWVINYWKRTFYIILYNFLWKVIITHQQRFFSILFLFYSTIFQEI